MIGDHDLIIALVHWQAWDEATRDAWIAAWDATWGEHEREPESGA